MSRAWHPRGSDAEWNSRSALIDRPPATTLRDVLRLTAGPTARFIIRHARAFVAAARTYRETINAHR